MQNQPELLLPAGNVESFYAALQGGADAVYLGLKQFNARGRASNFTNRQLAIILKEAKQRDVRIYVTLNTVIKNSELPQLIDYLHFLSQLGVNGILIQDLGVLHIARKYFPELALHASTQMGIHNSVGSCFAREIGLQRVVLARELTLRELTKICKNSSVEIEVFVHGALCYSFSGMCLFSSFIGGWGANRGLCAQPCRRTYTDGKKQKFLFNLKDNQLIDYVNELAALGIKSFKIEGRMKSGEYTYRVAKAYRMALDDFEKLPDARELLAMDFGRRKTSYFLGHDVDKAISDKTVTGILLGKVERVEGEKVFFSSTMEVVQGFRLRFHQPHSGERENVKVKVVEKFGELYVVDTNGNKIIRGSKVFLSGITDIKFPSKLEEGNGKRVLPIAGGFKRKIFNDLKQIRKSKKTEIFVRVDSMEWLRKIFLNEVDGLLLSFSKITWSRFHPQAPFVQKNRHKIFVELPKFIAEDSLDFYSQLAEKMAQSGLRNFVVSHLSQKKLIPKNCRIFSNENVYVFNDAAVKMLRTQGVETFIYPQEIDFETLETLTDRSGIVPVYFYPELFYSRMPIQLESREQSLKDDMNVTYRRFRKNGVTIIVPCQPVSILQFKNRLIKNGFNRFLIDVSYDSPSKNKVRTLKSRLLRSEQVQPSVTFNFVKGLK